MNTETLHSLAHLIEAELGTSQVAPLLEQLTTALTNQVNSPSDPGAQQQVSDTLARLRTILPSGPSSHASPLWWQHLNELGVAEVMGDRLLTRIEDVFARNQITVAVARDEIARIQSEAAAARAAGQQLLSAFSQLRVGVDELAPGEVELAILIPRSAVRNELGELGRDFATLRRIIGPFQELATGGRAPVEVRAIASSDFSVVVDLLPVVGDVMSWALARIVDGYKAVVAIRRLKQEMEALELADSSISSIEDQATARMAQTIETTLDEMWASHADSLERLANGRPFELKSEMKISLETMATKVDLGYSLQVRALPAGTTDEEGDVDGEAHSAEEAALRHIQSRQDQLEFLRLEGEPILKLGPGGSESHSSEGE